MNTPALDNDSLQPEPGPLNGVRVLDVATVYAAPITAMLLGDYGADVLKIEHPRGDPARTHGHSKDGYGLWWKVLARNKRAVTLNRLRAPGGRTADAAAIRAGRRRRRPGRGDHGDDRATTVSATAAAAR